MNENINSHSAELPFRTWREITLHVAEGKSADERAARLAEQLAQHPDNVVFVRRHQSGELWKGFVALWSDEATAFSTELRCPMTMRGDEPMPAADLVPVRIGDHMDDENFLRGVRVRLTSLAPYDPEGLPDFPEWLWYSSDPYERFNLLIDEGQLVLPPGWERRGVKIGPIFCSTIALRLIDGRGRMGLMGIEGKLTVPCSFAYLSEPDGWGTIVACEANRDVIPDNKGRCDIIDAQGRRTNPEGVKVLPASLLFGKATAVADPDDWSGRIGIMASDGRMIGGIRWSKVGQFHWKLAVVQDPDTKLFGYIDESGNVVIEPAFENAYSFDDNRAIAGPPRNQGRLGLIDRSGRFVAEPVWHDIDGFIGRYFKVTKEDGAIGLIDDEGRIIIEPRHPTPEEQAQIEKTRNYIRAHPFTLELGAMFKKRIDATLIEADNLAPLTGMFSPAGAKDIELQASGLLWREVVVVADFKTEMLGLEAKVGDTGCIGWDRPVSGSIFNLAIEAPVRGLPALPHGSLGVPWRCLKFVS